MTPAQLRRTPAARYLALRARLVDPAVDHLDVPADTAPDFWSWYADWLRGPRTLRVSATAPEGLDFPEPDGRVALWASQGMGSAYTLSQIAHLSPEILRYESFSEAVEPERAGAPLAFVLAVLGAHHGFAFSYVGPVAPGALGARDRAVSRSEDGAEFRSAWNRHHPRHRMRSVCEGLTRERLLALLPQGAEAGLSSCERKPGEWCRDCAKCFESFYAAKAIGRPLDFRLSRRIFDQIYTQAYRTYLESEFRSDPRNSLQYYVYLQISYGLVFDPADDTE